MIIAGYAIGQVKVSLYRAEYPLAIERVEKALKQAYQRGLLGNSILGSSFNLIWKSDWVQVLCLW